MLLALHIENVAVVKSLDIDFSCGMTVLSGETGAGKSIILDSLGLLLGARADRELIRNGEERAEVSAVFGNLQKSAIDVAKNGRSKLTGRSIPSICAAPRVISVPPEKSPYIWNAKSTAP